MILDTFLIMDHFVIIWFIDRQLDDDVRTWKATFFSCYCYIPSSTFHVIVQHIGPGNISWNCTKLFETESSELWVAFSDFVLSFDPFVYIGNCSMSNILPLPAQSQRERSSCANVCHVSNRSIDDMCAIRLIRSIPSLRFRRNSIL